MLRTVVVLVLFLPTIAAAQDKSAGKATNIHQLNQRLGRGINLGNALEAPKEGEWGVTLRAEYFRAIKEAGFDTVRLPVKWSAHAKPAAPHTIEPKLLER